MSTIHGNGSYLKSETRFRRIKKEDVQNESITRRTVLRAQLHDRKKVHYQIKKGRLRALFCYLPLQFDSNDLVNR